MMPSVSITLSVFNVESFIRPCLDCIVNQTLHDIEIICVNDGSIDASGDTLKEYATKDDRIIVIDKKRNEGLAVARNEALALAKGKYVGFVDGDDLLDLDLFQKAYECAESQKADLVFWDYAVFCDEDDIAQKASAPSSLDSVNSANKFDLLNLNAFAWTKLLRTDVVNSLNISFPRGLTYQDVPVHWKLITQLDRIAVLPQRLSYYRQQPEATTHRSGWKRADLITVMDMVKKYLDEEKLYHKYRDFFLKKQLEGFQGIYDVIDRALKPRVMELIHERMGDEQWNYVRGSKPLRPQARTFFHCLGGSSVAKIKRAFWLAARHGYRTIKSDR